MQKKLSNSSLNDFILDDIIITAVEGGINYWCSKARPFHDRKLTEKWVRYEKPHHLAGCINWIGTLDSAGKIGFWVDDESKWYFLTRSKIEKSWGSFAMEYPKIAENIFVKRCYDAYDADAFMQFCIFGKLVFG